MQNVLVTGASKGIGRATAQHLAAKGFHVYAAVRKPGDAPTGDHITEIILDVTKQEHIDAACEQIGVAEGTFAGLVNNAGIAVAAPLEYFPIDDFRWQLEVNLVAQVAITQAFLPLLRRDTGRIIMMSSVGGRIAGSGLLGAYCASKFGMEAVCDVLRIELRPWGIKTIAVEPGAIATPIWTTSSGLIDRLRAEPGTTIDDRYGKLIDSVEAISAQSAEDGLPPIKVAQVVETALTAPNPRARYLVGADAKIAARIIARLPEGLRDRLIASRNW